ncbi:hypothetical protein H257_13049 [Aphanomyces astaci]|uniref:Uncharacterized protein n=1 Tax=Aphanomyces astaci TaxID=112090 RepID=W4FVP3_APHAT|nr:hypothetical protein H257_13049 [Aphanomyces astaci]ETV71580.1 hypothetical protein H257_13049 [Aphanomyces astaci]RHY20504.1 hypothetical protein DYB25_005638 [Aphanomyces astaci]RHY23561.1 hypothetical protein DYB36_004082 [Aphanomyces astaci]RHY65527.1 hypothetical protein DYB30_004135 [Aphanomyces astaci]RHY68799.1 hypothetical protein DYB38_007054 [Aphanomyces astaci]|eukprot:XP_009838768.1 hypothetical protein H257_13049 [Aphanomyces astaci]
MPQILMTARRRGRHCPHEIAKQAKKYSSVLVRGFSAGNISVVDKRSWLEVCDQKHRYGANLRAYYKEWKRYDGPKPGFWEWLDDESIEVEGVPRTKLESETVLYCDPAERQRFELDIRHGMVIRKSSQEIVDTGDEGWIFVLRDGILYGSEKVTTQVPRIHHTSLVGGECVQTAGMMVVSKGTLRIIYPHSGHYRPSENELLVLMRFLAKHGIAHREVLVDVQRMQKVARESVNGVKTKKIDSAHFWNGQRVLNFLELKDLAWRLDLFHDLETEVARWQSRVQSYSGASPSILRTASSGDDTDVDMDAVQYDGPLYF